MASMTNITVDYGTSSQYTWASMTPGSATAPARWRGTADMMIGGANYRSSLPVLSFRYQRNAADTADRFTIAGSVPIVCLSSNECPTAIAGKVPFSFTLALPDALPEESRAAVVEIIAKTISNSTLVNAIEVGTGFY